MNRKEFLKKSAIVGGATFVPISNLLSRENIIEEKLTDEIYFLGSDQNDNMVRLFSGKKNNHNELTEKSIWKYHSKYPPTDAKRVDVGNKTSVIISSHGEIYEVPYNSDYKVMVAETYGSCHSVEKLPDGNLISASSNDNQLTIHFNRINEGPDKIRLKDSVDFEFESAHGVVYDKTRKCIWALGKVLGKFEYVAAPRPYLLRLETYPLPLSNTDGHDIFPHFNGNLLITTHQGLLELQICNFAYPKIIHQEHSIKSAVPDIHNGEIYITDPKDISHYNVWQTDTITNLKTGEKSRRPGAKFYKVRLWQRNSFSYS